MATAIETGLKIVNVKFEAGDIDADTYFRLISKFSELEGAPSGAPVHESEAAPTALSNVSRRVYIKVSQSKNFEFGHLTLSKGTRRFGMWAEDVLSVITQLSEVYETLPQDVRDEADAILAAAEAS
jgi:hypothetical protein